MSTSPTSAFTGSSNFSSSLAQFVARSVSFASLPMQQLQNQETTVQGQQTEVATLQSDFQGIQNALTGIDNSSGSGAYTANVDVNSVASASVGSGVFAGSYSINVLNTGSHTNTLSNTGLTTVTDPSSGNIDSSTSYSLTVDSQTFSVSNPSGSLNSLAQAINASGANVQATVVNVGSPTAPDYRLSVQGSKYSPTAIQLTDGTNTLLNQLSAGTYVQYQVNGSPSTVNSDSRSINLSTGLTVSIAGTGTANITVAQSASGIANAVNSLVSAYNTAFDEIAKSRGQGGGALSGQSVVYQLSSALSDINGYISGSGNLTSLSDVGIAVDQTGHLTFNSSTFNAAASKSVSDVVSFFGSVSGGGFLQSANSALSSITDPTSGTLTTYSTSLAGQLTDLKTKVGTDQTQINTLQTNLTNQMSKADAAIASMEQTLNYMTTLFAQQQANQNTQSLG